MQKKIYFLSGFPRAGNTIISTILNQNKNIATSGHSSLPDCFFKIESIKYTNIYNNFKNNKAIENIQKNLVLNFYKDWKQPYIIDRGEWGTPYNYEVMKKFCPNEFKIIFLLRNPLDIIKSYLKICIDNPNFYINKQFNFLDKTTLHKTELEEKIDTLIQKACKDLKTRIMREVSKSLNKTLKEQARELKSNASSSKRKKQVTSSSGSGGRRGGRGKKSSRNKDDSDSDYYDE